MKQHIAGWQSPSNIAIIKYWGKHGLQLPRNPSLSFTLSKASTTTTIRCQARGQFDLRYTYQGEEMPQFVPRVRRFVESLSQTEMPWLSDMYIELDSSNSFPHSSGIASSASFMSSLALCLCEIEGRAEGPSFWSRASHIARLGSGSAARSLYGGAVIWGQYSDIPGSSDLHAIPWTEMAPVFHEMHNDILIVSSEKKAVSSSQGHRLMESHAYATTRYQQARTNLGTCLDSMKSGDIHTWGKIVEEEALTLHGLMMNSPESYILMKPATLECIQRIRGFRAQTAIPVFFTLDAGPNVHMLYPASHRSAVEAWRQKEIDPLCERVLEDQVGSGPQKIHL